jgi:hypothetical protein
LASANYSPLHADRYRELHFRIVDERLYRVANDFPRLSSASFVNGLPAGIERVEYKVNLETCQHLIVSTRAGAFSGPPQTSDSVERSAEPRCLQEQGARRQG